MHSAFKQRQLVAMVTKWLFFFQGEKGDTGLRGLDGNAGVKVDTTVLSQFNPWPNAGMN